MEEEREEGRLRRHGGTYVLVRTRSEKGLSPSRGP